MGTLRLFAVIAACAFALLGGCAQRVAVEGTREQLYAEAKGALEAEGFRPLGARGEGLGVKGSSLAEGRLQFLYYADNIAPTVVEVRIEPGEAHAATTNAVATAETRPKSAGSAADGSVAVGAAQAMGAPEARHAGASGARGAGGASGRSGDSASSGARGESGHSGDQASVGSDDRVVAAGAVSARGSASAAGRAARSARRENTPHSVAVSAWSSLTFAPDPWIADLAVVALRRAYLLSGNIR